MMQLFLTAPHIALVSKKLLLEAILSSKNPSKFAFQNTEIESDCF